MRSLLGLLVAIHGLIHLWFVVLSLRLVPFQPEMGWTGRSWLLSPLLEEEPLRWLAVGLFSAAAIVLVVAGIAILADVAWWRPALLGGAIYSAVLLVLYWDGSAEMIVQQGLIGLLINVGLVLMGLLWRR